jgi:hypothetical protein
MEFVGLLVVTALLVSGRIAFEAGRRWLCPEKPDIVEELHRASNVTLVVGGRTVEAHCCVLKSVGDLSTEEAWAAGGLVRRYSFDVFQFEPWK